MAPIVWQTSDDGKVEFVSLSKATLQGALDVLYTAFFPHENVCKAVGLSKNPAAMLELRDLCVDTAKDGVSIVAVEKSSGTVIGTAFNKLQRRDVDQEDYFVKYASKCNEKPSEAVLEFMADVDAKCDLFGLLGADAILEIMFLGTSTEHRGKHVSTKLCEASIEAAEALREGRNVRVGLEGERLESKVAPKAVSAIFTSFITQRIGRKLGFTVALSLDYDELEYEGKKYSETAGPETTCCTVEYKRI